VTITRTEHEGQPWFYSTYEDGSIHEHGRIMELDGWAGGRVETSQGLYQVHRWFAEKCSEWPGILNATEGGAAIAGARPVTLESMLALPARELRDHLPSWVRGWDGGETQRSTLRAMLIEKRRSLHFARQNAEVASELLRRGNMAALKGAETSLRKCIAGIEAVVFGLDRKRYYVATQLAQENPTDEGIRRDCATQFYRLVINADVLVGPTLQETAQGL
jgi:hypothetical protein